MYMLCLTMPCDWFNIVKKYIDFNFLLLAKVVAMYTTILIIHQSLCLTLILVCVSYCQMISSIYLAILHF